MQKLLHKLSKMYLFTFSWYYFFLSVSLLMFLIPIIIPGIVDTINGLNIKNFTNGTINPILLIILYPVLIILNITLPILSSLFFLILIPALAMGLGPLDLTNRVIGINISTPNPTLEETIIFYTLVLLSLIFSLIAIKFLRYKNYSLKFLLFWMAMSIIGALIFYNNYQYMNHVDILNRENDSNNHIYLLIMLGHSAFMTISALCLFLTRNKPWKDSMDSYSIFKPFSSPKNLE